jgi:cysteinyl-tRNA synthetase
MSKSLKNFSTIKEYLSEYNHREMRFLFLLNQWDKPMNFNPETSLEEARAKDKVFKDFFRTAKSVIKLFDIKTHP